MHLNTFTLASLATMRFGYEAVNWLAKLYPLPDMSQSIQNLLEHELFSIRTYFAVLFA